MKHTYCIQSYLELLLRVTKVELRPTDFSLQFFQFGYKGDNH